MRFSHREHTHTHTQKNCGIETWTPLWILLRSPAGPLTPPWPRAVLTAWPVTMARDTHRSGYQVSPANPPTLDSSRGSERKQSRGSRFPLDERRTVDSSARRRLVVFTCQSSGFPSQHRLNRGAAAAEPARSMSPGTGEDDFTASSVEPVASSPWRHSSKSRWCDICGLSVLIGLR